MPYSDRTSIPFLNPSEQLDGATTSRPQSRVADNLDITSQVLISGVGRNVRTTAPLSSGLDWLYRRNIASLDTHKTAIDKLDNAIGPRTGYTPGRYIVDGESVTTSLDALQLGLAYIDGGADFLENLAAKMGLNAYTPPSSQDPNYYSMAGLGYSIPLYYLSSSGYFITLESGIGLIDRYVGPASGYTELSYLSEGMGVGNACDALEESTRYATTVGNATKSWGKFSDIASAVATVTSGTIFVKRGRYTISSPVTLKPGVHLEGEGYATEIYYNGAAVNSTSYGAFHLEGNNQVSNVYIQRGAIRLDVLDPALTTVNHNYTGVSYDIDSEGYIHMVSVNWYTSPNTVIYDKYERTCSGIVSVPGNRTTWQDSGFTTNGACMIRVGYNNQPVIVLSTTGGAGAGTAATTVKYNLRGRNNSWGGWTTITTNADPQYDIQDAEHGFFVYSYKTRPPNYTNPNGRFYVIFKDKSLAQLRITKYNEDGTLTTSSVGATGAGDYAHRHDKEVWMDVNENTHEVHIFRPLNDAGGGGRIYYTHGYFDKNDAWVTTHTTAGMFYFSFASCCGALDKRSGEGRVFIVGSSHPTNSPPAGLTVYYKKPTDSSWLGPYKYTPRDWDVQEMGCIVDNEGRLHVGYNTGNNSIDWVVFDPNDNSFNLMYTDGVGENYRYPELRCTAEGSVLVAWSDWTSKRIRMFSSSPAFTYAGTGHAIKSVHLNNADITPPRTSFKTEGVLLTYKGK